MLKREIKLCWRLVARCLISSLDNKVDSAWAELAEKRYVELVSGKVRPVLWEDIKKEVKD